jgi:hypothetical protein
MNTCDACDHASLLASSVTGLACPKPPLPITFILFGTALAAAQPNFSHLFTEYVQESPAAALQAQ